MDNKAILEKAIAKAIANGYDDKKENLESVYNLIIFNHDFAKALWGKKWPKSTSKNYRNDSVDEYWKDCLQQMVIAEDPIKYLGENL